MIQNKQILSLIWYQVSYIDLLIYVYKHKSIFKINFINVNFDTIFFIWAALNVAHIPFDTVCDIGYLHSVYASLSEYSIIACAVMA